MGALLGTLDCLKITKGFRGLVCRILLVNFEKLSYLGCRSRVDPHVHVVLCILEQGLRPTWHGKGVTYPPEKFKT